MAEGSTSAHERELQAWGEYIRELELVIARGDRLARMARLELVVAREAYAKLRRLPEPPEGR